MEEFESLGEREREKEVYQILKGGASARKSAEKHKHYFILE